MCVDVGTVSAIAAIDEREQGERRDAGRGNATTEHILFPDERNLAQ